MASPAFILRKLFIDRAVAVSQEPMPNAAGWPVVAGSAPPEHDRFISIRNTGAMVELFGIQRTGEQIKFPTAQVRIRGEDEETASTKGDELIILLCKVGIPTARGGIDPVSVVVGVRSYLLTAARVTDGLTFLKEEEENQRQVYVFNVRLTYTLEA